MDLEEQAAPPSSAPAMLTRKGGIHRHPLLARLIAFVVAPLIVAAGGGYLWLRAGVPMQSGTLYVAGLLQPVRVIERGGITHIDAATDRDAFFALGYAHARERMWQMEVQRRLAAGRLSEAFGRMTLRTDQFMRTLGLPLAASSQQRRLEPDSMQCLSAYADGVNAWLRASPVLPVEYYILGIRPEPWRIEDSLMRLKLFALTLGSDFQQEILAELIVKELGVHKAGQLFGSVFPSLSIGNRSSSAELHAPDLWQLESGLRNVGLLGAKGVGSNGWVVSGALTRTGKPLLANDPHLPLQVPSAWYVARLRGDRLDTVGATIPGLPLIVVGRNGSIAWGITAVPADVQDLYIERTHPRDDLLYEADGQWLEMHTRKEVIEVARSFPAPLRKPEPPAVLRVRSTRHGPIISDATGNSDVPLALRWTALDEDDESFRCLLRLNYALDWNSFRASLRSHVAPVLSFLYADTAGNIGSVIAGRVPTRAHGDGQLPAPGWSSDFDWTGHIEADDLPSLFNPPDGYIVAANDQGVAAGYRKLTSNRWDPGYRAERIRELIISRAGSRKPLGVADFIQMQGDEVSLQARELLGFLAGLAPRTAEQRVALRLLREWDGSMSLDSVAATIYMSWALHMSQKVVQDELVTASQSATREAMLREVAEELRPSLLRSIANAGMQEWCNDIKTDAHENCQEIALSALDAALRQLRQLAGDDPREWQWGKIHKAHYSHWIFGVSAPLRSVFDREISGSGDAYTINAASPRFSKEVGYRSFMGPSYRQVIDLGDWSRSVFSNSTGQTGSILGADYDAGIRRHRELGMLPMQLDLRSLGADVLRLEPLQPRHPSTRAAVR